ncbi:MAG: LamG-like jellyroll fold domain-containing protein, partial [Limisphaerales bacterium]
IIPMGKVLFRWTRPATNSVQYLQVSSAEDFHRPEFEFPVSGRAALIEVNQEFQRKGWWFWRVVSSNEFGITTGSDPFARFRVNPTLARVEETLPEARPIDRDGNIAAAPERLEFKGADRKLFDVGEWPEGDYAAAMRFRLRSFPTNRLGQLFSAWTAPMDDPLRITIENGKLSARIESGGNFATPGIPIQLERWYQLEVTKAGSKLTVSLDGKDQASCAVPKYISTRAKDFALGGNPHFGGNEFVDTEIEEMRFRGK